MNTIAEIFVRHFFPDNTNLFACVCFDDKKGIYHVQLGHKMYRHMSLNNALNRYNQYISLALAEKV